MLSLTVISDSVARKVISSPLPLVTISNRFQ
jgi:hypothetical protein